MKEKTMTLDEAIYHAKEVADNLPSECDCGRQHIQLYEWLLELKEFRKRGIQTSE